MCVTLFVVSVGASRGAVSVRHCILEIRRASESVVIVVVYLSRAASVNVSPIDGHELKLWGNGHL